MAKFFRALFRSDDGDHGNLIVDLFLNDERRIPDRIPCFGYWGKIKTRDLMPFIYQAGQLDFGDYEDEDDRESTPFNPRDRYAQIDLQDRIIAVGEYFVIIYDTERWVLRLEKLTDVTLL